MMAEATDAAKRVTNDDTKTELAPVKERKIRFKYCIVPECKNTTVSAPEKLFFSIPTGELRNTWCDVMGRRPPHCKPLSPMCNRFCCEDHFDLEKDMNNYIQWKLMGRNGTSKLLLKKGVLPHKFDCQHEIIKDTKTQLVENRSHREFMNDILKQSRKRQIAVPLDQRLVEVKKRRVQSRKRQIRVPLDQRLVDFKKHRVNILKRQITEKVKAKQNRKVKKLLSEEDNILEQRKKIDKILHATQTIKEMQEQGIETYTFEIKMEAEDNYETNDGDSVLGGLFPQGIDIAGEDNKHLLGVNVKVEELDEEFEPELKESKQENITEDEADVTLATDIIPALMENSAPCINVTNNLIEPTSDEGDDFEPVVKEETNIFLVTENITDKEVYERVITGQRIQKAVADDTNK